MIGEAESRTTRGLAGNAESRTTAGLIFGGKMTAAIHALRRVFAKDTIRRIFAR